MARQLPGKGMEEIREENLSFNDVREYMETIARDNIDWEICAGPPGECTESTGFLRARGFLAWESGEDSFSVIVRSRGGEGKAQLLVCRDAFETGWLWKMGHMVDVGASMKGWSFNVGDGTGSPDYER